ncbi:hypothetical protein A3K86_04305 [Photobacterium jeanii]|uniref:Uncharacterized protein n=1 Tax=Photobacterium jeanii TaxID=858640 RepID=A0A178KLQ7_9GAMM|nr:hypothetical protein [Photobacterium jeanii]OAN18130.1 hypothetical protein A3K86_04305 [Photobacterium jeanii]PST92194.1 hypothetical protein C9I91_03170 [Photobacterium jeanii]
MVRKILLLVVVLAIGGAAVNFYRTNMADDVELYGPNGDVIATLSSNQSKVMMMMFSYKTNHDWNIDLPGSKVKVTLTDLEWLGKKLYAKGDYEYGEERGQIGLNAQNLLPLNFASINVDKGMVFAIPFWVSNQGSGRFDYLGLFYLDHGAKKVTHLDTYFVGDRVKLAELKVDAGFESNNEILLSYYIHGEDQAMAEEPNQRVEKMIKVSPERFVD